MLTNFLWKFMLTLSLWSFVGLLNSYVNQYLFKAEYKINSCILSLVVVLVGPGLSYWKSMSVELPCLHHKPDDLLSIRFKYLLIPCCSLVLRSLLASAAFGKFLLLLLSRLKDQRRNTCFTDFVGDSGHVSGECGDRRYSLKLLIFDFRKFGFNLGLFGDFGKLTIN